MPGLWEGFDLVLHGLVHDALYTIINLMPNGSVTVLGIVDPVESLCHSGDGVVRSIGGNVPFFPFKLSKLVKALSPFNVFIPSVY